MDLEKTQLKEGINECGKLLCSQTRLAVVEIFDTPAHPELTAIQVRCIVNRVLGASGKM